MKTFTKKSVAQKILIVLIMFILLSFSIPKPVHAVGGILLSPITTLATTLLDSIQHLLEYAMLGETSNFMKDTSDDSSYNSDISNDGYTVEVNEEDIDGALWGLDAVNVPNIQYTPEEIFSNRVPALDINFIKPSVKTGSDATDQKMNVAIKLQPVISSWYVAIRTLAVVGLLSVLVYLGIRMILSGVAADKAKYKKMLMDWLVAMCLIFALHYIMSLALTLTEVVTSLIAGDGSGAINVKVMNGSDVAYSFKGNLMSYVRFMIQSTDPQTGLTFLALYLMLIIYNVRFTWTYLKRVVNMAFLTLIAPIVALTYPIDKVSDGKAQAFDMWIKEFTFNALLQPLHLLLYTVLLGASVELAVTNPLYAIVCLGFILTGEKLLKQMFNFGKASGGTVGSLAGAAGVSALANKALMSLGKGPHGGKGGAPGKVRTNDQYKREGKNTGANKGYNSFDKAGNQGQAQLDVGNNDGRNIPSPSDENANTPPLLDGNNEGTNEPTSPSNKLTDEEQEEYDRLKDYAGQLDGDNISLTDKEKLNRLNELEQKKKEAEKAEEQQKIDEEEKTQEPDTSGSPNPAMTQEALEGLRTESNEPETWRTLKAKDEERDAHEASQRSLDRYEKRRVLGERLFTKAGWKETGRQLGVGTYKTIRGIKKAAPTVAYKAARGALKTGARVAAGVALGATAGVIGATMGDGEKALGMAGAAFAVGAGTGGNLFEGTAGKVMQDKSIRDTYGAGKHGSAIDARNEKADKAYMKSAEHNEEYEKYFKEKMTKAEFNKATKSYREAGITDKKTIRNALKLEEQYVKAGKDGGNREAIRGKVQNIVQTYDAISPKAIREGDKGAREAALKNIESQLTNVQDAKQRRAVANEIFQGYRDWYNVG